MQVLKLVELNLIPVKMKFFSGLIVGVLGTLLVLYLLYSPNNQTSDSSSGGLYGLTIFPEKGECVPTGGGLEVLQVVKPNMALSYTDQGYDSRILVLLINYDGKSYYDDQKIKIPTGKCARQIGTYQYKTNMRIDKTVTAVVIE